MNNRLVSIRKENKKELNVMKDVPFHEVEVTVEEGVSYKAWMSKDDIQKVMEMDVDGDGPIIELTGKVRFDIVEPELELAE